jgi:hypothetical protein
MLSFARRNGTRRSPVSTGRQARPHARSDGTIDVVLVLVQANRKEQATAAFRASLDAIDNLAPALRAPRATTLLAEQVHQELAKLGGDVAVAREAKP